MTLPFYPSVKMSDDEFRLFRDLVYDYCGIYFDNGSKFLLEMRLGKVIKGHKLNNFKEFYYMLKFDNAREEELNNIIELLTTNETYFFREQFQLKAFSEEILPEIHGSNKGDRLLRIWSAGCSTGEEPYTIAILIKESGLFNGWRVEIFANDISNRVLSIARAGLFSESSFRITKKELREKYFEKIDDKLKIKDEIKAMVDFGHTNLMDENKIKFLSLMDVIFCRNVIIYFNTKAKRKVIDGFYNKLKGGGFLLLGHSESLINFSTAFMLRQLKNDLVYQKPMISK